MSITAALAIAKATGLDSWIVNKLKNSDNGAAQLASKVLGFATGATGAKTPELALAELTKNAEQQEQFVLAVTANEQELKRLAYADKQNAREMYQVHNTEADKIAERIMKWNLPAIALLLIVNVLAAYYLQEHSTLLLSGGNVLGIAIKSLFDERKEVTGFFFGSSMGSKQKDQKGSANG